MMIGARIAAERAKQGLSLSQLAERAGIDLGGLGRIERGETKHPQRRTLAALSDALGVELCEPGPAEKERSKPLKDYQPRFAFCRKATGHSRADAAKRLGIRTDTLESYELCTSYPPAWMVLKMARLYGVSCSYLLGERRDLYKGRYCLISYCEAGELHDYCCFDCPDREGCGEACTNAPERCRCVREKRPNEMFGGTTER